LDDARRSSDDAVTHSAQQKWEYGVGSRSAARRDLGKIAHRLGPLPIRPISLKWIFVPRQVSWLADQAEISPSQPNRPVDL